MGRTARARGPRRRPRAALVPVPAVRRAAARMSPLILGAGPAGSAAAIALAQAGARPLLLDRDAEARDQLCGGFLSWRTAEQLRALGIHPAALGARTVERLAVFAGTSQAE